MTSINFTDKQGDTALIMAARTGNIELCESYIKAGADLNKQNHKGETALMEAAKGGYLDIVSAMIKAGANLDIEANNGRTPLMAATSLGHGNLFLEKQALMVKQALIDAGAKLRPGDGEFIMTWASCYGEDGVVKSLIDRGVSLHHQVSGWTFLMMATMMGHTETAKVLLEAMMKEAKETKQE